MRYADAITKELIHKTLDHYPEKDETWAREQWDRVIRNTDGPVTPDLIRELAKYCFGFELD